MKCYNEYPFPTKSGCRLFSRAPGRNFAGVIPNAGLFTTDYTYGR